MNSNWVNRLFFFGLLALSSLCAAELKELDDQTLEEQKGQAGITIDVEFELSIGEIAHQFGNGDKTLRKSQSLNTPEPSRIEYVLPDEK